MTGARFFPSRRLLILAVIAGSAALMYHAGYRLGREAGIRDITVDSIKESLRSRFLDVDDRAYEDTTIDDEEDPFASDPFAADPMDDPLGDQNPFDRTGPTGLDDPFSDAP